MFDEQELYQHWLGKLGKPRGDEHRLHAGDLGGCDYATWLRLRGEQTLAHNAYSLEGFRVGHDVEKAVGQMLAQIPGVTVEHGREIEYERIVGHIDYIVEQDGQKWVIDPTTTKGKTPEAKDHHVIKTAFYAMVVGAKTFADWVFCLGFGGTIKEHKLHVFKTAEFAPAIEARIPVLHSLERVEPEMEPPLGQEWRCGKPGSGTSYCAARCPKNAALSKFEQASLQKAG